MSRNTCNVLFVLFGKEGDIMWNMDYLELIPEWIKITIVATSAIFLIIYLLVDRVHRRKAFTNKNSEGKEKKGDELR